MTSTSSSGRPFAVVTGASSGIGYELAKQFLEHGYDVLVAAEDHGITQAASDLGRVAGSSVQPLQVDLATYDGVEDLFAAIGRTGRPLAAIAINAGRGAGGAFASGTDLRDELNIVDVNVTSTVHLAKRVLPGMVERGEGRVLLSSPSPRRCVTRSRTLE
jgi:short-subunit dehydrogenase